MAHSQFRDSASQAALAWFIGGGLMLVSVVATALSPSPFFSYGSLSMVLFAAALLVFAFGVRGQGSVTARRPLGTITLVLLAVWTVLGSVLSGAIADSLSNDSLPGPLMAFAYADSFVQFALALICVMQIARLGVVPAPWNWLPAWIVGAVSLIWLLLQLVGSGVSYGPDLVTWVLMSGDGLARVGGTMLLGVLAIVLADRATRRTTTDVPLVPETLR